uniref:Structural glycoprotein p40 n=1 Tax=Lygus hesperus TaxID=30085 RepID=A0A0A9YNI6_LYGHE
MVVYFNTPPNHLRYFSISHLYVGASSYKSLPGHTSYFIVEITTPPTCGEVIFDILQKQLTNAVDRAVCNTITLVVGSYLVRAVLQVVKRRWVTCNFACLCIDKDGSLL